MTTVAAIIPTIGRPQLARAVASALRQTIRPQILVILDRPELAQTVTEMLAGLPHELILTSGGIGGSAARNVGIHAASADYVAYLDDDDEWDPVKTEEQLALVSRQPGSAVTTRATLIGSLNRVVPEVPYANDMAPSDYLLQRSTIRLRKNFMQTSTLLLSREVALQIPWDESLKRHQDWALFIELRRHGVEILTHPDSLVNVYQNSAASISKSTNWRASVSWLNEYAADAKPTSRADFLLSIAFRSAIAARDFRAASQLLTQAILLRPHPSALIVGLSSLMNRSERVIKDMQHLRSEDLQPRNEEK